MLGTHKGTCARALRARMPLATGGAEAVRRGSTVSQSFHAAPQVIAAPF
jgi:hypothetical protein